MAIFDRYHSAVARIPAPAKWRGLKTQFVKVMADRESTLRKSFGQLKHKDLPGAYNSVLAFDFSQVQALDKRFDAAGVTSRCVALRLRGRPLVDSARIERFAEHLNQPAGLDFTPPDAFHGAAGGCCVR